jgi:hypothetical protein
MPTDAEMYQAEQEKAAADNAAASSEISGLRAELKRITADNMFLRDQLRSFRLATAAMIKALADFEQHEVDYGHGA